MPSDFATDAEEIRGLQNSALKRVSDIANQILTVQDAIESVEQKLKELNSQLKVLTEQTLPDAMKEVGLRTFELDDGTEIGTKEEIFIGMPEQNKGACLSWLRDNGFGDLIKNEIKISFGMGDDVEATKLRDRLVSEGAAFDEKITVPFQTLKAWAREQDRKGNVIPENLFSVHRVSVAKLKAPKR